MNIDDIRKEFMGINNDIFEYKGYFVENEDEDEGPKYYEFGAHFPYQELFKILQNLSKNQISE